MGRLFSKYLFQADARGLTMFEVSHVYQLTPEPPVMERVNDYIVAAIGKRRLLSMRSRRDALRKRLSNI